MEERRIQQPEQPPPRRPNRRRQFLWGVGIVAALAVLASILGGYVFGWEWTGIVEDTNFHKRTLWDWMQLLIIPAVLAGVGLWFNRQQREQELLTADRRAQDEALQAYLDQMSAVLIPNRDLPSLYKARPGDSLSEVARARTLTVLSRLDGERKARVVQFLNEAGLVAKTRPVLHLREADLRGADLSKVNLSEVNLSHADLKYAILNEGVLSHAKLSAADLRGADLRGANLYYAKLGRPLLRRDDMSLFLDTKMKGANLSKAYLRGAILDEADLEGADLSEANLRGARLRRVHTTTGVNLSKAFLSEADLRGAWLSGANLRGAILREADLRNVYLSEADLRGAYLGEADLREATGWTEKQLAKVQSLKGATMPNGQKYEDWLKSKGRDEDGKNSGPS